MKATTTIPAARRLRPVPVPEPDAFAETMEDRARHRDRQVEALFQRVEDRCATAGSILAEDSPERVVLGGTIMEYARTCGLRPQDTLPKIAFTCPSCQGVAEVEDAIRWRCFRCGPATRAVLARRIIETPELLAHYLEAAASRSSVDPER